MSINLLDSVRSVTTFMNMASMRLSICITRGSLDHTSIDKVKSLEVGNREKHAIISAEQIECLLAWISDQRRCERKRSITSENSNIKHISSLLNNSLVRITQTAFELSEIRGCI